ncbi:MAG TPA: hypothetical protein PKW24_04675 [Clostridiales bacterium]|nr:hypothetical protein [Clostridiales bacterium]
MACFLVPVAEAVITTVVAKAVKSKEEKLSLQKPDSNQTKLGNVKISWGRKLRWLNNMLWGGVALLAFEHLWHGEVVPWFPFLTAAADSAEAMEMLTEMATVGVAMAVLITSVWALMVIVANAFEKRELNSETKAQKE